MNLWLTVTRCLYFDFFYLQNGQTALSIAQRLGYISVVETLKVVTEKEITTTTTTTIEEKYKVLAPESMQETFMSDSEDEGGRILGLNKHNFCPTLFFLVRKWQMVHGFIHLLLRSTCSETMFFHAEYVYFFPFFFKVCCCFQNRHFVFMIFVHLVFFFCIGIFFDFTSDLQFDWIFHFGQLGLS